jgi:hypothetical protein
MGCRDWRCPRFDGHVLKSCTNSFWKIGSIKTWWFIYCWRNLKSFENVAVMLMDEQG